MTIGHPQAAEELTSGATATDRTTRPWPQAVAAAAAVTAIVAALALVPALAGDRTPPSPAPLPPIATLPPGVVPWIALPAPPVKARPSPPSSPLNILRATLTFPARLTLGVMVSYTVTLANPTLRPVPISPCPSYSEALAGAATPVAYYYLNCEGNASIPAKGSVTFEMMAPEPMQLGRVRAVWHLQRTDVTAAATGLVVAGGPAGVVS